VSDIDAGAEAGSEPVRAAEILAALSGAEGLPRDALDPAAENWEAVLPAFLETLAAYVRDPEANADAAEPLFFIVHLFGQMRETRAYRPLMELLGMVPDPVGTVLGDAVTTTLPQIAASVFDGDPEPMQAVILNPAADEFVRSGLLEALAFLTGEGRIPRERTADFLRRCETELRPRATNFAWVGWQSAITYLGLSEMTERVRAAFADERIDPTWTEFEDFEGDLRPA